ncbi:hypothetical protein ACFT7S_07235 [Streptomyces sp. NPDC057136]|uniref:hypothetical protein n=1 Tax=Streptomyces sp. NPDC057136 TaxID=3346029 RepID=UPI00362E83C3
MRVDIDAGERRGELLEFDSERLPLVERGVEVVGADVADLVVDLVGLDQLVLGEDVVQVGVHVDGAVRGAVHGAQVAALEGGVGEAGRVEQPGGQGQVVAGRECPGDVLLDDGRPGDLAMAAPPSMTSIDSAVPTTGSSPR